jgi:transcriptional regulator with PAS, ATPase and Fis domain
VDHFLILYSGGRPAPTMDGECIAILWDYDWPGNVRELQNVIRRILLSIGERSVITRHDIPSEMRVAALQRPAMPVGTRSFRSAIEAGEKELLARALDSAGGNQSRAASTLDMKLSTFRDKLAKYNIRVSSRRRTSVDAPDNSD